MDRLCSWILKKVDEDVLPLRPHRQPTGEAQRSFAQKRGIPYNFAKYILATDDSSEDVVEANIKNTFPILDDLDPLLAHRAAELRQLLRDYGRFKTQFGGDVCRQVLRCWTFPSSGAGYQDARHPPRHNVSLASDFISSS